MEQAQPGDGRIDSTAIHHMQSSFLGSIRLDGSTWTWEFTGRPSEEHLDSRAGSCQI